MANKVKGKYILDTDYEPKRATGINITELNNDEIVLSFFEDVPSFPEEFEMELDEKGNKVDEKDLLNDKTVSRLINSRIWMKKEDAVFLFKLLVDKLEGEKNDD